jgi:predicted dehydrogenase
MSEQGSATLSVGVIGLGYWGPNLLRVLHEIPDVGALWACDVREDALAAITRRYPSVVTTTDAQAAIASPDLDAIVIATPVSTHYELALGALVAGKHVFVEKPLTASVAEAEHLVEVAAERSLMLMPGHTFLYSPPVNLIHELITSGELGEIYFISTSRVNLGLHQPDIGVAWDLGPHDFSILRYWMDELPSRVSALSRSCIIDDLPDVAFINLAFPSGAIAHVELSWLAPSKLRRTAVVGSKKMVVYDDTSNEPVRVFDSGVVPPTPETFGEYKLAYRSGDIVSPRIEAAEPLLLEMTDFCNAIRTGVPPRSNVQVGVDVVRICDAVDRSLRIDGAPVDLEHTGLIRLGDGAPAR